MLNYVEWDLHHISLFGVGNRVCDQMRGVAIGGPPSAQLASTFCLVREAKFYERGEDAVARSVQAVRVSYGDVRGWHGCPAPVGLSGIALPSCRDDRGAK